MITIQCKYATDTLCYSILYPVLNDDCATLSLDSDVIVWHGMPCSQASSMLEQKLQVTESWVGPGNKAMAWRPPYNKSTSWYAVLTCCCLFPNYVYNLQCLSSFMIFSLLLSLLQNILQTIHGHTGKVVNSRRERWDYIFLEFTWKYTHPWIAHTNIHSSPYIAVHMPYNIPHLSSCMYLHIQIKSLPSFIILTLALCCLLRSLRQQQYKIGEHTFEEKRTRCNNLSKNRGSLFFNLRYLVPAMKGQNVFVGYNCKLLPPTVNCLQ